MEFESSTDVEKLESQKENDFGMSLLASTLAHEIRNPLQAMRIQLDAAARGIQGPDTFRNLNNNLDRLEGVVRRVEGLAHRYSLTIGTLNLEVLKNSALSSIRFWLEACGIKVRENVSWEGDPVIQGDRELLEQVLLNLLMNALQAMPHGGRLQVNINECQAHAEIEVTDSGVGISREGLKLIGTPFFTTKESGNGLGVAFCKSIVTLHGGQIDFESEEGKGTKVSIRIPKKIRLKTKEERPS